MLNSDPLPKTTASEDAVTGILRKGAPGALAVAALATAIVLLVWFAFFLLVFVPRASAP